MAEAGAVCCPASLGCGGRRQPLACGGLRWLLALSPGTASVGTRAMAFRPGHPCLEILKTRSAKHPIIYAM